VINETENNDTVILVNSLLYILESVTCTHQHLDGDVKYEFRDHEDKMMFTELKPMQYVATRTIYITDQNAGNSLDLFYQISLTRDSIIIKDLL
jgi:hypothetical protein